MSFKIGKKAVIGKFTVTFVATILIILILVIYTFFGLIVKTFEETEEEYENAAEFIPKPGVLSRDFLIYRNSFLRLTKVRFLIQSGESLEVSLENTRDYVEYKEIEGGDYMPR